MTTLSPPNRAIGSACRLCGKPITLEPEESTEQFIAAITGVICNCCADEKLHMDESERQARARFNFKRLCPPLYQDTDVKHPSMPANSTPILTWTYGPKGLLIHGPTERCKSRLAWLLIKSLMLEGRSITATTAGRFASQSAESSLAGANERREWFDRHSRSDVLFIDDLGKFKLTERVEADLFEVIDHRVTHLKPIIATTNMTGDELRRMMSADRGAPLIRRLREFCEDVAL